MIDRFPLKTTTSRIVLRPGAEVLIDSQVQGLGRCYRGDMASCCWCSAPSPCTDAMIVKYIDDACAAASRCPLAIGLRGQLDRSGDARPEVKGLPGFR